MKIEETNFENCIDFSNAVLQMRCQIINACKAKGLEPPTNKQISDYIIDYGVNVKDFMADYEEGEGMFRGLAFQRFKDKVSMQLIGRKPQRRGNLLSFSKSMETTLGSSWKQETLAP